MSVQWVLEFARAAMRKTSFSGCDSRGQTMHDVWCTVAM